MTIYFILYFSQLEQKVAYAYEQFEKLPVSDQSAAQNIGFRIIHNIFPFALIAGEYMKVQDDNDDDGGCDDDDDDDDGDDNDWDDDDD